jgi:transposase
LDSYLSYPKPRKTKKVSDTKKRKVHSAEFKAGVGLQALNGLQTINQVAQDNGVHPVQVRQWKSEIQQHAKTLFDTKQRGPKAATAPSEHESPELLFSQIGRLKVQLDWLQKKSGICLP